MIIRIRLKRYPDKYVGREDCTYAFACDESRSIRLKGTDPTYYTDPNGGHLTAPWFVPEHRANTWTKPADIKRTLSSSAYACKWHETTWTAYEVVHVDTGVVEPLDVFLLAFRKGLPDPALGDPALWAMLKRRAEADTAPAYPLAEAIRLIPKSADQRQDSTTDQLTTVLELARRAGCYDAYDLIKKRLA